MENVFLRGNFAPVGEEQTVTDLTVTGRIPDFLDGRYIRIGPNPAAGTDPGTYHWFMGDGMVHGLRLRGGKAEWYRNRWVRTPALATRLGEPYPGRHSAFPLPDFGANTNVLGHAGKILTLIEAGAGCFELDGDLGTAGACDFDGAAEVSSYTGHPKRDPVTGELHAVSYYFRRGGTVQYSVIGTDGRARHAVDIEVTGSPMMHDFALTEKYVVLYDLPVTYDPERDARAPGPGTNGPYPYRWNREYPARIGVLPRDGGTRSSGTTGDVRWFDVDPCAVVHTMNAYDDGDTIVLDMIRYSRVFDAYPHGPVEGRPTLYRWTIDLPYGKVREEQLDDRVQEFPRIDDRLTGRKHRYGYATRVLVGPGELLKHDLDRGEDIVYSFGDGKQPSEFTFVPRSPDAAEDDGVLMGFVYSPVTRRSDLEILEASSLDTLARVRLPVRVPYGFHGNWIPSGLLIALAVPARFVIEQRYTANRPPSRSQEGRHGHHLPRRQLRPGPRGADRHRPVRDRPDPGFPGRPVPPQRAEPGLRGRPGDLPLVHRRRHGARRPAARRPG